MAAVQQLVESNYVQGQPRHHLPSASRVKLEPGASMFFIVEYSEFCKLSPQDIQEIYRHRNIVIRNVPQRQFDWSLETLSEVGGALKEPRDIQGTLPLSLRRYC